jgi:hypothetical protein
MVDCSTHRRLATSCWESSSRSWWQGRVTQRSFPSITAIQNRQQCHELAGASSIPKRTRSWLRRCPIATASTPGPAERQRQLAEARAGTFLAEGSSSVHKRARARAQPGDPAIELVCLRPTPRGQGDRWRRNCPLRRSSIHVPAVPALWPHRTGEHPGPGTCPRADPGTRGKSAQAGCSQKPASCGSENLRNGRGVMSHPPQESPGFSPGEDVNQ